ncbi:MAG: hypothetical protein A3G25_13080 [Betaproteobacteria bacterium RIFCSPLOWO2_12_FULL_63_13]|nr:MAG: hypothetical protein A3H32_04665 [Betaproteobacteria bacterium RIFCSPLOWO2_02_FULL_63_19]OGA48733.1 MAG: hypothetical protein A3G25_13080 [Betaproteobacteria bacterium RIFCSPLOWO2_12_FULL_63_13]
MTPTAAVSEIENRSERCNVRLLAHNDLNGHGDGMQLLKVGPYVYVAHLGMSPMALTILDATDPEDPRVVRQTPHAENTHAHKVQIAGNVLIQNQERPYFAKDRTVPNQAGIKIYDLSNPTDPREIAYLHIPGKGVHRMWFSDGKYAHVAADLPGYRERVYLIVDLSEPSRPRQAGHWWMPGTKDGEQTPANWQPFEGQHFSVHGIVPHGNRAYVACVDAGMAIVDISNPGTPRLISRLDWSPPYGGYTHTTLPLPGRKLVVATDESVKDLCQEGEKRVWVIDIREERNPVTISSFPVPQGDFPTRGRRFGPHNVHENRPGSFQSEKLIFVTYYNAGLRVVDIRNPYRPEEVGYFVPPAPPGQAAIQINDVFVDADGLIYITDRYHGGLYILEYTGPGMD